MSTKIDHVMGLYQPNSQLSRQAAPTSMHTIKILKYGRLGKSAGFEVICSEISCTFSYVSGDFLDSPPHYTDSYSGEVSFPILVNKATSDYMFLFYLHQSRFSIRYYNPHRKLPTRWLAFGSNMTSKSFSTSGSNSNSPFFVYTPLEGVERLEKYRPGGYHPIAIGDILQTRYRVVHKLGYGTYSTTWLCRDDQSNAYVAVKVGTGDSNHREADVLDRLNSDISSCFPKFQGRAMVPLIQDRFDLHGPNGIHPCYVTTPARCSVSSAKDGSYERVFQASTARSLIAQLVLAVEYIHAKGIVHGGWSPSFNRLMILC